MDPASLQSALTHLEQIASALQRFERSNYPPAHLELQVNLDQAEAFIWRPEHLDLRPVPRVNRLPLGLLIGIDSVRDTLVTNTSRFAQGLPANNALLWGARGTGKSSLIKAVHAHVAKAQQQADGTPLVLVEIQREDIATVSLLLEGLRNHPCQFLLFCDDLSFDHDDAAYKSLKAILDGGLLGRPENVLFYATSNRRHLMPRDMIENERSSGVFPGEAVEEKLSLSDRFGLWLGLHRCDQETYLKMIDAYVVHFGLNAEDNLHFRAKQWATIRGSRSGRVAWQFIQDLAAEQGKAL